VTRALASRVALALALALVVAARADEPLTPEAIFGPPKPYALESVRARFTHFDQRGHGYQSQADGSPGSEQLTVEQSQVEIVARQGERITHTLWLPLDIITAASPDAVDKVNGVDTISSASRINEAGSVELATAYRATHATTFGVHGGFHFEEQFRSWDVGTSFAHSFADDNAVIAASLNQYFDFFDKFNIHGVRLGRLGRSSTNLNVGITQLLSSTTVAHLDYGVTLQTGELGNTWNAVPTTMGDFTDEILPTFRQRHAFVARLAQWLPWRGALHSYYRFYVDDWGVIAHTVEETLYQHLTPWLWLRANYRLYQQNGVSFFTTVARDATSRRTADSDLAPFWAHTVGGAVGADVRAWKRLRQLHADVGYERYWRTNDLTVDIITCALGFVF
jgi:hypothetical protein